MYHLQNGIIESAIEILEQNACNDDISFKTTEAQLEERFKTRLSSPELSYFLNLVCETVSVENGYSKSSLSKVIAQNFSTKQAQQPKASQIRKHFTEANDTVKDNVKNLVSELFDRIHRN